MACWLKCLEQTVVYSFSSVELIHISERWPNIYMHHAGLGMNIKTYVRTQFMDIQLIKAMWIIYSRVQEFKSHVCTAYNKILT